MADLFLSSVLISINTYLLTIWTVHELAPKLRCPSSRLDKHSTEKMLLKRLKKEAAALAAQNEADPGILLYSCPTNINR